MNSVGPWVWVGDAPVADGYLLDLIRQVNCFGLCLVKLDIRQESDRHADAVDAITRHCGLGSYLEWDEEKKIAFLVGELEGKRPLISPTLECSAAGMPLSQTRPPTYSRIPGIRALPWSTFRVAT